MNYEEEISVRLNNKEQLVQTQEKLKGSQTETKKPRWNDTEYSDFISANESHKQFWEKFLTGRLKDYERHQENRLAEIKKWSQKVIQRNQDPVRLNKYFGRQQFYRQNGLPVELNLLIEEQIAKLYDRPFQKKVYGLIEDKGILGWQAKLEDIARYQNNLKELEQMKQNYLDNIQEALNTNLISAEKLAELKETEVQRLLAQEIEDYKKQWQEYLNTKPLPELPQKQSKIKALGNKLKTEIRQVFKPLPKVAVKPFPFFWIV